MNTQNPAEAFKATDAQELYIDIKNILLATDGSKSAINATKYAIDLAKLFKAKVRAVFVDNNWAYNEIDGSIEVLAREEELGNPGYKGLAIARDYAEANDVSCEEKISRGNIPRRIIENANEFLPDLIIIGNSEKSGLRRTLGSVVDAVIKGTDIPVLVVRDI